MHDRLQTFSILPLTLQPSTQTPLEDVANATRSYPGVWNVFTASRSRWPQLPGAGKVGVGGAGGACGLAPAAPPAVPPAESWQRNNEPAIEFGCKMACAG